jgi:branched-chain amino acid transport system permease protein
VCGELAFVFYMEAFLSSLVSVAFHGVAYGMILYVISVGLSVTMGLMGFTNLAHGVFAMAGGYVLVTALSQWDVPFPLALLLAFVLVALASVVLERLLYSRLYGAVELEQVLLTIGLIFMSVAVARLIFGTLQQPVVLPEYLKGQFSLLGRDFPAYRVFLILFSASIIATLWFGVERTIWGAKVRAAVDNRAMAQSIGINTRRLFAITFAVGSGLAGLGGALGAEIVAIQPTYPFEQLVYFLIVVSVGGLGSLRGPFVAALLIGITDTACKYWLPQFGAFFIYIATIGLLLWRPSGLFGKRT